MTWNFMQFEQVALPQVIEPLIGPGGLSRQQAHAEVQHLLDRAAAEAPDVFQEAASIWRRGAQDDTVYAGPFVWALYEHPEGQDPRVAAVEWLEDYAAIMRRAGATNIQVASLPAPEPPGEPAPDHGPEGDLVVAAARRVAGHVRELRKRYPTALANFKHFAGQRGVDGLPDWPQWCWVPMSGAHAIVSQAGPLGDPAEIGRAAAVGQWKLQGRDLVVPDEEVAARAVPGPASDVEEMDLAIPRERLLAELAGACYYLVMPVPRPAGHTGPWLYGTYLHLEWDQRDGGRAELRFLLDFGGGWEGLSPAYLHADLPTLAWSARETEVSVPAGAAALAGLPAEAAAAFQRLGIWLAWPLAGALLDDQALLVGPRALDDPGLDAMVRGGRLWQLTYRRPRPAGI